MTLIGITHDSMVRYRCRFDSNEQKKKNRSRDGIRRQKRNPAELTTTAQGVLAARRVSALAVQRRRDSGSCRHLGVLLERCNVMGSRHLARSDLNSKWLMTGDLGIQSRRDRGNRSIRNVRPIAEQHQEANASRGGEKRNVETGPKTYR